jgi:hypothetical protein
MWIRSCYEKSHALALINKDWASIHPLVPELNLFILKNEVIVFFICLAICWVSCVEKLEESFGQRRSFANHVDKMFLIAPVGNNMLVKHGAKRLNEDGPELLKVGASCSCDVIVHRYFLQHSHELSKDGMGLVPPILHCLQIPAHDVGMLWVVLR